MRIEATRPWRHRHAANSMWYHTRAMRRVLDHVQLAIPRGSEDIARRFYTGVLGFEEVAKPPELASRGGAWFRSGAVTLHLGVEDDFMPAKKAHPALRCEDYATILIKCTEHKIDVILDPLPFAGRPHCYIADPFGNRIELISDG